MRSRNILQVLVTCFISFYGNYAQPDEICNSPFTSDLRDDQFSASSEYRERYNASAARRNGVGWRARNSGKFEFLKLDLEFMWEITAMDVQDSSTWWYTKTFRISYSSDGYTWTGYNSHISDDSLGELFERTGSITKVTFDPSIKARYIAINPVEYTPYASLRIELYGCRNTDTTNQVFTNIQNDIEADTTWIPSQSPIIIDRPLAIRPLAVLTVKAGVIAIFTSESARIDVYGNLTVEGIQGLSATFSSNHPVLSMRSTWQGVIQGAGGYVNMTYATIRQAVSGFQGNGSRLKLTHSEIYSCEHGLRLSGGTKYNVSDAGAPQTDEVILSNVNVHDNQNGLAVHGNLLQPDVPITRSHFDRNDDDGIVITNWDKEDTNHIKTNLYISNSFLSHNLRFGIKSNEHILSNFYIRNATFAGNRESGLYYHINSSLPQETLNVTFSYFFENGFTGLRLSCYESYPISHFFQNNSFIGHTQEALNLTYAMRSKGKTSNVTIVNNRFEKNQRDIQMHLQNGVEARLYSNHFAKSRMPVKITGNEQQIDSAKLVGNFFTDHSSVYQEPVIELDGVSSNVTFSSFVNSSKHTIVKINKGFNHSFEFNRFINTSLSQCYLKLDEPYDPDKVLDADKNYWGALNKDAIKAKVCDFFQDSNKAIAKINTFFPTISFDTPMSSTDLNAFSFVKDITLNATVIGGVLNSKLDLATFGTERFVVNRSLIIAENASLNISNATLLFSNNRGIVVHGSMAVGNENNDSSRTIFQSLTDSQWNGISLYSKEIVINSLALFGTPNFLSIHGPDSRVVMKNSNMSDSVLQSLIFADMVNGNLSISIQNSTVKSRSSSIHIKANDSRKIDLEIEGSTFSSGSYVTSLSESTTRSDLRHLNINISNCAMHSRYSWTLSFTSCSSRLTGTISGSNFSSYNYDSAFFSFSLMNLNILGNNFGDSDETLFFQFCNQSNAINNFTKAINISGNTFNSSRDGKDITIYKYYTNEKSHEIKIYNNTFGNDIKSTRRRIYSTAYGYSTTHVLVVDSNLFINSSGVAVDLTNGYASVIFKNNTFANNTQCIRVSCQQQMNSFDITNNTFLNNTFADGVVNLDKIISNNTNVIGNSFVNNTNTVIAFRSPNTTIRNNFFENGENVYNLKVLSGEVFTSNIVNASLNYWGTTDVKEIAKTIYDNNYDETLIDIAFRPYLASRNVTDIQNEEISFVSSAGEIGGSVNGNITLKIDQSPYLVVSNVAVEDTDTLNIDAGVKLVVKAGVGFKVDGELNILGTESTPVYITPEVTGIPWRGIDIRTNKDSKIHYLNLNDSQEGIKFKGSSVSIKNITSTYARQAGIFVDIQDESSYSMVIRMSEVILEHNDGDGINIIGESENITKITVENCRLNNNLNHGIKAETNAEIHIENCFIRNNAKNGIHLQQSGSGIIHVNNSVLSNNSEKAIYGQVAGGIVMNSCSVTEHNNGYYSYWRYWHTSSYIEITSLANVEHTQVEFINTSFIDNIADGILFSKNLFYAKNKAVVNIEGCKFSGGNRTLVLDSGHGISLSSEINIRFVNNTVENNTWLFRYAAEPLIQVLLDRQYKVEINGNVLRNNTVTTGFHISSRSRVSVGNATILNNRFFENNFTFSTIEIDSEVNIKLHENIFKGLNNENCVLSAQPFNIHYTINATYNYWGTPSAGIIVEKVCGFEKDMDKSFVWYLPFYKDEELVQTIGLRQDSLNLTGSFGGEITKAVTLFKSEYPSPAKIDRSIMIREGGSLNVEPGVVLQFERNRGIYVQGSMKLIGGDTSVVLESVMGSPDWYGVVINSSSQTEENKTVILNTRVQQSLHGVVLYSNNVDIKRSTIANSTNHCLSIYQSSIPHIFDFEMSSFQNCTDYGIYIAGEGSTTVTNVAINMTRIGVGHQSRYGSVAIRNINISDSSDNAINVKFTSLDSSGNVTVDRCLLSNCSKGLSVSSRNYRDYAFIKISRNTFQNIFEKTLDVVLPAFRYSYARGFSNRTVDISYNTFYNTCGVAFETWNNVNLTFHDNVFSNALCTSTSSCFVDAHANGNDIYLNARNFDISTNTFQNISCTCLFKLRDQKLQDLLGTFIYNQLLDISASEAVVVLDALYINVTNNIFDNPKTSFDVYAYIRGEESVNVTQNWWGSSDAGQVYNRIFDQRRDPNLVLFNVDPVSTEREIDCTRVNNCSSNGECVSPNRCRCYSGWTGDTCMKYDCAGVNDCYGNGDCTRPNTCKCHDGWSGKLCIIASCLYVSNCSRHGICVRPNVCKCADTFTGNDCSSCVPLHWGSKCRPCPDCQQGTCNLQNGLCECNGENWSGYLCDKCSEKFYGPECLPLIKVLNIIPNQGLDKGGNLVHVWGHNFPETNTGIYICKFGTKESNGTWLAWNHVVCRAPQLPEGIVHLEISPDGVDFTNDNMKYFFYASCPPGSCGRDFNPSRGQCLFGGCSCFLPWIGDSCSVQLLTPVIAAFVVDQAIEEADSFNFQLNLTQGSPPILWSLLNGPTGMTINERTGRISWKHSYAKTVPYRIEVRAKNVVGADTVAWSLNVPVSYSVAVKTIDPNGVLSVPRAVEIYGTVTFLNSLAQRVVPVDVIVASKRSGRDSIIHIASDPHDPTTFKATYYPRPDDSGLFTANARHPGAGSSTGTNVTWSVLGMKCEPSYVSVDKKILSDDGSVVISNISSLLNVGDENIEGISAKVYGLSEAFARISGDTTNSQFLLLNLAKNQAIHFDLAIKNSKPWSGTIHVLFETAGGTKTRLIVHIKLSIQKPVLNFDPPSLTKNIVRGQIKVFDIHISNTGAVDADQVEVSLPNDSRLSMVSFAAIGFETESDAGIKIPSGGAALLSVSVTTESSAELGEIIGTMYINSELTSTPFRYNFVITSLQKFNVTFTVKDEYTYFAAGSPLVSNAMVRLVNPRRGFFESKFTTNETGYVVFNDVYEDQYSLYAEAEGHSSYGAVILITPDNIEQDIFLQRVAVKYTWTVEPTTVEDVYIIQLESTFETYVPMPVVTIEPAKVNTIPLELEETDTINFNITNHGLIRADNVRFNLPENHPYLKFELTVDFIGSVDANTSIIVPIRATLKNRVKRNAAAASVCGLALLYDYDCGGTQTRSLGVTLTREYPGRPPLPCGFIVVYGRHASGTGTGRGFTVTYNPTTPLSCDCAKTLIKSCALAYLPFIGCALAVTDLGTSYARNNGDIGTLKAILGLTDTAFSCLPLPGSVLYTTVRCLIDVESNCDGSRRRREISSEVVNNMLTTAQPMDNFLQMMSEILGDEAMYDIDPSWNPTFKKTVGDDSELGTLLSSKEATSVLETLTEQAHRTNLSRFLERWNNTAASWENGTLTELEDTSRVISLTRLTPRIEQYVNDMESSNAKGFDSIFDEFDHATNAYNTAEQQQSTASGSPQKNDGVCARVRVRIIQELVLTRDAFNARLEIENGESSDLQSIRVEIQIKQTYGNGELTNDKFSIGNPVLIGISGVDGTGSLDKDLSGSAEWLIIPYSNAAPEDDTRYDIGGRLSYSVGGSEFSVPLLPDTITVKPNPSLIVHYFHEKYVRGDDALTPEKEPIVPFSLAILVMNNGYGVARALKITSGQPEIIENEKGLLITFKIIGAQLGNNPVSPSLAVKFGDISAFETKTARWLMTTTLMGTFYNFSATFENINPLGDPQLSLLDELGYHELIHLVRIEFLGKDDDLDDFLVNDKVDNEGMPDKLYNSANGTDIADVFTANITDVQFTFFTSAKTYKIVTLSVKTNTSVWFYARKENTFTDPNPYMNENLLHAESSDGRELLVDKNVWQTTHIHDTFYLHLVDFVETIDYEMYEAEVTYKLVYGPRNMYAPKFNATSFSASISITRSVGYEIITVFAHDLDNDKIEFKLRNENMTMFNIRAKSDTSATLIVDEMAMEPGLHLLEVIAKDSGIPPKYAYVNVTIKTLDLEINVTTIQSTSPSSSTRTTSTASSTSSYPKNERSSTQTKVSTSLQDITTHPTKNTWPFSSNATDKTFNTTTAEPVLNTTITSSSESTPKEDGTTNSSKTTSSTDGDTSKPTESTSKGSRTTKSSSTTSSTEGEPSQTTVSGFKRITAAKTLIFIAYYFVIIARYH